MNQQFQGSRAAIHKCITGLTKYAAQLAAQHQEEQLPQFRRLCVEMAEFWDLTDDNTPNGCREMTRQYTEAFDHAVSSAKARGHAPEMTEQAQRDVLAGLELYALEMRCNDLKMKKWAAECDILTDRLKEQWQRRRAAGDY